jgi:phage terminase large subunit
MLRDYQRDIVSAIVNGRYRHLLLIAPRRSGKSVQVFYLVNALINKYFIDTQMPVNATIFAPKQKQCREIYIDNILSSGQKLLELSNGRFIESRLSLEYNFGSKVKFSGSDMIDSHMGAGNKIIVLDEYALSKPEAFQRLYPMVNATLGHMIVCSTPRGRNHLHELYEQVRDNPAWLVVHTDVFQLGLMTQEQYDALPMHVNFKRQEFLCSWDSPFENAIYLDPQVTELEVDSFAPVYLSFDLGMRDATAIIIAQRVGSETHVLHSVEYTNASLESIVSELCVYLEEHSLHVEVAFVPHDTSQRDYITGRSRFDYLSQYFTCHLVTRCGLLDGIELVRNRWHNIYFRTGTLAIERVKAYITDMTTKKPKHDDASHMSDALRYLELGLDEICDTGEVVTDRYETMYRTEAYQRII